MSRLLVGAVSVALLAAVFGAWWLASVLSSGRAAASAHSPVGDERPSVPTIHPTRVTLRRSTTQPATVHGFFEAKVYARVSGYLKELNADIGDPVKADQVLARIDVPELGKKRGRLRADIARLEAEQAQAGAEVETARAQVEAYEAQVGQARAQVKKAQAILAAELAELRRIERVAKGGTLDKGVLNEAKSRYQAALAGQEVAESAVQAAQANATLGKTKLRAAQAVEKTAGTRTEVVRKEQEELDALIGFATLKAPFRGVVTTRGVDEGDLVGGDMHQPTNATPLFTVARIDRLRVRVPVPERDAPFAKEGKRAEFQCQAFPGRSFPGRVSRVAKQLDRQTRTMLVEVDLDNPKRELMPGMFGEVTLVLEERPGRLVLPVQAVRHDSAGKSYVLTADSEGRVARIDLVTGQDTGQSIEVVQGLTGREQVIAAEVAGIAPGQSIRCVEEK